MSTARLLASRSIDPRTKVGCVIVTGDNSQVLAVGYNGDQKGGTNMVESDEPGKSGTIHAEENALIKCDFSSHKEKIMYLTVSPCDQCAKKIINAEIDEVVYDVEYRITDGIDRLEAAGIFVRKFKTNE